MNLLSAINRAYGPALHPWARQIGIPVWGTGILRPFVNNHFTPQDCEER